MSSRRYKQHIQDLKDTTQTIYQLRPVKFQYRPEYSSSTDWEYGLIAEEVMDIMPDLVVMKNDLPETIKYQHLSVMLLNELIKLEKRVRFLERSNRNSS